MARLVMEIEVQGYDEDETEVLSKIRDTLVSVVSLCDLAVGTFTISNVYDEASA